MEYSKDKIDSVKRNLMEAKKEYNKVMKIAYPADTASHFTCKNKKKEYFQILTLNGAHEVIKCHTISIGILNRCLIHPRELFIEAIKDRAASIILGHNHPSGNTEPSKEDEEVTDRLVKAGEIIGISVLDHVILSPQCGQYSFAENNKI